MFKVGDRVECIKTEKPKWLQKGETYIVSGLNNSGNPVVPDKKDGNSVDMAFGTFKLIKEAPMDLRERIEALTGWDKTTDDLLQEIYEGLSPKYELNIPLSSSGVCYIDITRQMPSGSATIPVVRSFLFTSQCSKLEAFKSALLCLAEKAGKLDDKKDKIRKRVEDLEKEVAELKEQLKD